MPRANKTFGGLAICLGLFYLQAHSQTHPLRAWVVVADKYGLIDSAGQWVLPPQYAGALPFQDGLAATQDAGRWGYLRPDGTWQLAPTFEQAGSFSNGLAPVSRSGWRTELIDTTGQTRLPADFGFAYQHRVGQVNANRWATTHPTTGLYGILTAQGDTLVPFHLAYAGSYSHGRICIVQNGGWQYLDTLGKTVFSAPPGTEALGEWGEGYGWLQREGRWEVVDSLGRVAPIRQSRFEFLEARDAAAPGVFSEGVAAVRVGGRWGYLRPNGTWAINPQYGGAGPFQNGWAQVQQGTLWGYIDPSGQWRIRPQFDYALPFSR
jgi:WG containing repeat